MAFWNREPVETTQSGIEIKSIANDKPAFEREYRARISDQVSMKITCKNYWSSGVYTAGELTQSNGRWVLFEPERPADKILDRELLPTIEKLCQEILATDHAWRRSDPAEFVDKAGVRWRRVV